jgi:hypothetical protein
MVDLFKDRPGIANLIKIGIIAFIGLSIINLCYSIKVNRALLNETEKTS